MDTPSELDRPKTRFNVIFRDVPACKAEDLSEILLNNADARRALVLFLQDGGLLPTKGKITWDDVNVQIKTDS